MSLLYEIKPGRKKEVFIPKNHTYNIKRFISEKQDDLLTKIEALRKVLINAKPGTGKTTFIFDLAVKMAKANRRLVFVTPRLILQDQFAADLLSKKKLKVNKLINGESKNYNLESDDYIIVSTDKSFHKIYQHLTPNDIVVVDEAHTIMDYMYDSVKTINSFNIKFLYALYSLNSSLILMTGTVYSGLTYFLNLHRINFKDSKKESNVILNYSKYPIDIITLGEGYAKYCIKKYDPSSLNVIYIKNKNKCEDLKIKLLQLGYNAIALTSEHKETEKYIKLAKTSLIDTLTQFLICTNLLEVGVNINNNNIGEILMINTYDPKEVIQFTARFRNKEIKDITIVNEVLEAIEDPENYRDYYRDERNYYRQCFEGLIGTIEDFYDRTRLSFDETFLADDVGTQSKMIKDVLSRYLVQEAYYIYKINQSYTTQEEFSVILKHHGLEVSKSNDYIPSKHPLASHKYLNAEKKKMRVEYTNLFMAHPNKFETEFAIYATNTIDFSINNKYYDVKDFFNVDLTLNDNPVFRNNFIEPICRHEVLLPYLEYINTLHDCKTTLLFIRNNEPNKRKNTLNILEYFNLINQYCDLSNVNKDDKLIIKKGITVPNNKDLCRLKEITNLLISHLKRNYLIKPKEVVEYINRNDIKYSTESNTISK